ncbi:MAG: hypothetical protein F4W90_08230 [Gammaproteobacteria bacterium]|nr:hypothetical protein [Gammaproteobacteria bacterium]
MKSERTFDRSVEDVGNIQNMEHFNLTVPDQQLAALFYVTGLGFTRDPYMDFGTFNMWINAGEQQFHLPKNTAQKFRGTIGIMEPNLEDLQRRLTSIQRWMDGTEYAWRIDDDCIHVTCPWGNALRIHEADESSAMALGIAYGDMQVPVGTCEGIARFYNEVFDSPAHTIEDNGTKYAEVSMGYNQTFRFTETTEPIAAYDGHHVAIYVSNFSKPHRKLVEQGLITEESDQHQYRFQAIIDPESGKQLTEIEHEVRSLHHPMRRRNLVNRNASQTFGNYRHGRDIFVP